MQYSTKLLSHEQQCDHSVHQYDNILQDAIAEDVEEEMELKPDLHVQLKVDEDSNKHADDDCRLIRLEHMKKHRMKSHPMVLDIACQSVEFHCAVLQLVGAEIPYAVVPADASRWGLVKVRL